MDKVICQPIKYIARCQTSCLDNVTEALINHCFDSVVGICRSFDNLNEALIVCSQYFDNVVRANFWPFDNITEDLIIYSIILIM